MPRRICHVKLIRRRSRTLDFENHAMHPRRRSMHGQFFDKRGFHVVFLDESEGILHQFVVLRAAADRAVGAVDGRVQRLDLEVEPAIVLRFFSKKQGILLNFGVSRLLKTQRAVTLAKGLVFFFGKNDARKSMGFRHADRRLAADRRSRHEERENKNSSCRATRQDE